MPESPELSAIPWDDPEALLTPEQVSVWTQLEQHTLANARARKTGPPYIKLGPGRNAAVRYRRRDVEKWLDDRTVSAT